MKTTLRRPSDPALPAPQMKNTPALASFKTITRAFLPLAAFLLCAGTSMAKEFKLPNDDFAIASIDIPKSWKPEAVDNGVEAQTEDGSFYMSIVAVGTEKGAAADIDA